MPTAARITLAALWCDQGMAHLLETYDSVLAPAPTGLVLLDFGSDAPKNARSAVDYVVNVLQQQQQSHQFPRLDYVIISHQDTDHWSLLNGLMDEVDNLGIPMEVGRIICGGAGWKKGAEATIKRLSMYSSRRPVRPIDSGDQVYYLDKNFSNYSDPKTGPNSIGEIDGVNLRILIANAPLAWGKDVNNPKDSSPIRNNGTSAVVVIDYLGESMILPGDATWQTLIDTNNILNLWEKEGKNPLGTVTVMSVPHHGSLTTMTKKNDGAESDLSQLKDFLAFTKPKSVVASAGHENTYKHPYLIILGEMSKYTESNGYGKHPIVLYRISQNSFEVWDKRTENVYTTLRNLENKAAVSNWLFSRSHGGLVTGAQIFDCVIPSPDSIPNPSSKKRKFDSTLATVSPTRRVKPLVVEPVG